MLVGRIILKYLIYFILKLVLGFQNLLIIAYAVPTIFL